MTYTLVLALAAGAVFAPQVGLGGRGARLIVSVFMTSLIILLAANTINITTSFGRFIYGTMAILVLCAMVVGLALISNAAIRTWFAIGAFLLLAETAFRTFPHYDTAAGNPGIKFFWPDWVYYPVNNFGYRDRHFVVPKPAGSYRIVLLGDSFTEGAGLSREQTFGRRIEQLLNVEIYNLGRSGYNTREEADALLRDGPHLDPDLVILNYYMNDAETHPPEKTYQDFPKWYANLQRGLVQTLGSYASYSILMSIGDLLPKNFSDVVAFYTSQHEPGGRGWKDAARAMSDIKDFAKARSIGLIGVFWPHLQSSHDVDHFASQVTEEMKRLGYYTVDLTPVFLSASSLSDLRIATTDGHPNAKANELVASYLSKVIDRQFLKGGSVRQQ